MAQVVRSIVSALVDWYLRISQFVLGVFAQIFTALKFVAGWAVKLLIPVVLLFLLYSVYLERSDFKKYQASDRGAAGIITTLLIQMFPLKKSPISIKIGA